MPPIKQTTPATNLDEIYRTLSPLPLSWMSLLGLFAELKGEFETAFPPDIPLFDSLRLLNFNRENLADHPLRQIWWMTPRFAQEVVQSIPDLNSWFIVKMNLQEAVTLSSDADSESC